MMKRHSAPRNLKVLGDRGVCVGGGPLISSCLQQEEDEPEPMVMWPVAGASLSGGHE